MLNYKNAHRTNLTTYEMKNGKRKKMAYTHRKDGRSSNLYSLSKMATYQ